MCVVDGEIEKTCQPRAPIRIDCLEAATASAPVLSGASTKERR